MLLFISLYVNIAIILVYMIFSVCREKRHSQTCYPVAGDDTKQPQNVHWADIHGECSQTTDEEENQSLSHILKDEQKVKGVVIYTVNSPSLDRAK